MLIFVLLLAIIVVCQAGIREGKQVMEYVYLACLMVAIGMLFWLKIFDVKNSVSQYITLLILVVSNLGFYFVSTSTSLEEAMVAQKMTYFAGVFLPVFYFFLVLEICHIEISRWLSATLVMIQCVIFGFVCTIGKNELFYTNASLYVKKGTSILIREYGPFHILYPVSMYIYMGVAIIVTMYVLVKRRSINRKGVITMVVLCFLAIGAYVLERAMHASYEFSPIANDILMIGALIPVYRSNLYTVYEKKDIINEQLAQKGFLTFDKKRIYQNCNEFMVNVFPELSNYRIGQKIEGCSKELQALVDQIDVLDGKQQALAARNHSHHKVAAFWLNGKYYEGLIHSVTNSFGTLKGYTIELKDDTANRMIIELKEQYNDELSKEVEEKTRRIREIQQKTILGMAQMVESRDLSTGGHIKRTSDVVGIFAKKLLQSDLGLDEQFLKLVIRSAPMHDLGKIGVDDAVLRKQGKFTDEEYNMMKKHSEIGYHMVKEILSGVEEPDFVSIAENVAHYHHEKVNGTGYPHGLKGDEIPIEARIMALADVFDALVSKRCYKDAFSYDKAFEIIENDAGTHFDEKLAKVFISCRPQLEDYYNKSVS